MRRRDREHVVPVAWPIAIAVALLAMLVATTVLQTPRTLSGPAPTGSPTSPTPTATPTPTPALPPPPPLEPAPLGASQDTVSVGGLSRMYRVYRPATATRLAPVVVMLHGSLGSATSAQQAYGWDRLADQHGFLVVYPDAADGSWNSGGGCCGRSATTGVDDVAFVVRILADLRGKASFDPGRIYAVGYGNGGMMAYRLACDTAMFAAIGAVAATMTGDCPNPPPVSVAMVHGLADTTIPYDGNEAASVVAIAGWKIPDLFSRWRTVNRCGGVVERGVGEVTLSAASCPSNRSVELVTLPQGTHAWPGVAQVGPLAATPAPTSPLPTPAPTSTAGPLPANPLAAKPFQATPYLWAFVSRHSR